MKYVNKIAAMLLVMALFAGCTKSAREEFKKSFQESYESSFRASFRSSFIESCTSANETEAVLAICSCIADDLLETFTTGELQETEKMKKYIQEHSGPKCEGG